MDAIGRPTSGSGRARLEEDADDQERKMRLLSLGIASLLGFAGPLGIAPVAAAGVELTLLSSATAAPALTAALAKFHAANPGITDHHVDGAGRQHERPAAPAARVRERRGHLRRLARDL